MFNKCNDDFCLIIRTALYSYYTIIVLAIHVIFLDLTSGSYRFLIEMQVDGHALTGLSTR